MAGADNENFSVRQEQVLLLASKGLADKQIAVELGVSIATIHTYWSRLRKKFDGGNRAELVTLALHRNATETLIAKESENIQLIAEVVRRAQAERDLAESQSRLQAIIDNTPVAVFVKDRYGRYILVNSVFQELVGRSRDSILGSRDHDLFGPAIGAKYQEQDQIVLESREPIEADLTIDTPEGARQFLTVRFPLIDSDDLVYAVGGFANDITSRTDVERKLQASERRYRTLIENSTDAITLLDKKGTILYASPSSKELLGLESQDIVGTNAFRYIDREDLGRILGDFKRLADKPGRSLEESYWLTDSNGSRRYVEGRGISFLADSGAVEVLLNYRDSTAKEMNQRRHSAKSSVAKALAEAATASGSFPNILRSLCESLRCDYAGIWLFTNGVLTCGPVFHSEKPGMEAFSRLSQTPSTDRESLLPEAVFMTRKAKWEGAFQASKDPRKEAGAKARFKSALAFPIMAGGEILGVVEVLGVRSLPVDKEFLEGLSVIGDLIGQFMKRKMAEAEELRLAKELADVSADLKASNEALERRVRTRTIELEELNVRLQEEVGERRKSEEDLLNMYHFSQQVIECSPDGIFGFDRHFRFTAWNRSMEKLTGVLREEVLGQISFERFPFLMEVGEDESFRRTLQGESGASRGRQYKVDNGEAGGLFDVFYEPVRNDENEVIGGIVMVRTHQPSGKVSCL